MKNLVKIIAICFLAINFTIAKADKITDEKKSLDKATAAIRDAFARGDVAAIVALHSPDIVKYFGGNNVVTGRAALAKGLTQMFKSQKMEFVENKVESTLFIGNTAVQTVIFAFKITPKNGGKPTIGRGRSMVVYERSSQSPTGWLSVREMAQAAPDK